MPSRDGWAMTLGRGANEGRVVAGGRVGSGFFARRGARGSTLSVPPLNVPQVRPAENQGPALLRRQLGCLGARFERVST